MFRLRFIFVAILLMAANAMAVTVTLTANDGFGTSSLNTAGKWSDGLVPSAGNDYSTLGYLLRTPSTAGDYTFAGDSLTVGGGTGGGDFLTDGNVNNNSFICKTPTSPIITVNNLILDASYIRDGMGSADVWTLAGNISVTANGGGLACQCRFNVDSAISGSGTLYIADNGSGEEARTIYINSPLNTYNGSILLVSKADRTNNDYCRLTFSDNSLMNFVVGASGVNNSISGTGTANFEGDFKFDLTSASTTVGDSWTIANATAQTFSDTFKVIGFTDIGGDRWMGFANGTTYLFSESTGTLTVISIPVTVIDDFESYANTAALQAAWVDASKNDQDEPGISSATATLVTRDNGSKAMYVSFFIPGGWDYPDANAPMTDGYDKKVWEAVSDTARIELTLSTPININADFNESWQLKFDLEPVGPIGDLGDLDVYFVDESGAYGRTLIPCPVDEHFQWWYPPEWCPAYLAEAGWAFPDNGGGTYRKYAGLDDLDTPPGGKLPYIYTGNWGQIICDDTRELNYGWGNVEVDTLTGLIKIALVVNSDTNLGEGFMRETEGGDKYPIKGGVYGFYIDNIELLSTNVAAQ